MDEYVSDWKKVEKKDIRAWIKDYENKWTRANKIKSARVFFDSFLDMNVADFKIPQPQTSTNGNKIKDKEELQEFYKHIENPKYEAIFLVLASSGLRVGELAKLKIEDIDFEKRMIVPPENGSSTKRRYITFYNDKAEEMLNAYLDERDLKPEDELFPCGKGAVTYFFRKAKKQTGLEISPQKLREWFCNEMGRLGVGDRFIDAYCGRVPRTVLAQHYTDFSPERLKEVYEKANLKVLE